MSSLRVWTSLLLFFITAVTPAIAADNYELLDGKVISGAPISFTKDGVAFREASGDQGTRIGYTNLTQQALQELSKNPKGKRFIEPFLEAPLEASALKGRTAFELKPHEMLDRPDRSGGLGKLASSGVGWLFILLLFAANLYSAYEVGIFRNYSPYMVMGIAFVLPVATQAVFLCLPTYVPKVEDEVVDATAAHVPSFSAPGSNQAAAAAATTAAAQAAGGAEPAGLPRYKRGEFTFNKRFFETKLSGFFGVRPSDAEKGLVFNVRSNRGALLCNKVVRVTPAEATLQVVRGGTIEEVGLPFTEILEIEIQQRA